MDHFPPMPLSVASWCPLLPSFSCCNNAKLSSNAHEVHSESVFLHLLAISVDGRGKTNLTLAQLVGWGATQLPQFSLALCLPPACCACCRSGCLRGFRASHLECRQCPLPAADCLRGWLLHRCPSFSPHSQSFPLAGLSFAWTGLHSSQRLGSGISPRNDV